MQHERDPRAPDDLPRLYAALACVALVLAGTSGQHLGAAAVPTVIAAVCVIAGFTAALITWRRRRAGASPGRILIRS